MPLIPYFVYLVYIPASLPSPVVRLKGSLYIINWYIPQTSHLVSLKMGFTVSVHRLIKITLLTLEQASTQGSRRPVSSMRTPTQYTRDQSVAHSLQRWVSTKSSISQLECISFYKISSKDDYRRNLQSHSWSVFWFFVTFLSNNIALYITRSLPG